MIYESVFLLQSRKEFESLIDWNASGRTSTTRSTGNVVISGIPPLEKDKLGDSPIPLNQTLVRECNAKSWTWAREGAIEEAQRTAK